MATRPGRRGTEYWQWQRLQRLVAMGVPTAEAARSVGIVETTAYKLIRRKRPPYKHRRCPTCGGMVVPPCTECALRRDRRRASKARGRPATAARPKTPG